MGGAGSGRKPGLYYDLARQYPRAYRSWQAMRQRCNPSNKDWKYYGGRGIKICDRWNDRLNQHAFGDHLRPASAVTGQLKSFRFSRV